MSRDGRDKEVTTANKIRLQDEIMRVLKEAAGEETNILMSQANVQGKSPQDLLEETRNRWQRTKSPYQALEEAEAEVEGDQ